MTGLVPRSSALPGLFRLAGILEVTVPVKSETKLGRTKVEITK